jgi:RNA polymerase sigma-70 factor (ECF subfamily)
VRTALAGLEPGELVLLRLHHVKGWSVDRLGETYRVGRSTAARRVAAAREKLVAAAKADLRRSLDLTPSELESLIALLQSNLQLSLVRLLDGPDEVEPGSVPRRPFG